MPVAPKPPPLRVLHLSDLHERVALDWMTDDRKRKIRNSKSDRHVVLGPELEERLRAIVAERPPDLLVFTGDLADWGLDEEYIAAERRLTGLLKLLGLGWDRVFLVPGNHDIQRTVEKTCWAEMRAFAADPHNRDRLSRWLAGEECPAGAPQAGLTLPAKRQSGYRAFLQRINRPELLPDDSRGHPNLGYRQTLTLPNLPPVHIIGLDTAWLAGDDNDKGRLLLTKHQVTQNATSDDGEPLDGLRLALMHHPLSDLGDDNAHRLLSAHMDLVLHGHQHRPVSQEDTNPDRTLRTLAAGSIYEGDEGERWVNSFHVLDVEMNAEGRPLRYVVQFYAWSVEGGHWHPHAALYKNAPLGRLVWETPLGLAQPRPAAAPPIPTAALDKFVGRAAQLAALTAALLPKAGPAQAAVVCNLQGMAGVGKSLLVERFFQLHGDRFPGGHLKLTLGSAERPTVDGLLQTIAERLDLKSAPGDLAARVRSALEARRPLLHLDNLDSRDQARAASDLVDLLPHIPLILTGRHTFDEADGWPVVPVAPFAVDEALQQLNGELGEVRAEAEPKADKRRLVTTLDGLPLAISLAGANLRAGRTIHHFLKQHGDRLLQIEPDLPNSRPYKDPTRKALRSLAATFDLSLEALRERLGADAEAGMPAVCALGVAPLTGVSVGWAAAIMGVDEAVAGEWLSAALSLSIVQHDVAAGRWRVHKLLAEHLRSHADAEAAVARMDKWVLERLHLEPEETRGARWGELQTEHDAVAEWVAGLDGACAVEWGIVGSSYALVSGPYAAWLGAIARGLATTTDAQARSELLGLQGNLARQAGDLELTVQAAKRKSEHDVAQGWDGEVARAAGLRADVLQMRGQLDEALKVRREEELSVYERIGDVYAKAVTMGKIADVLQMRGQLDEALKVRWEEQILVYERLGDVREKAIAMGKIADVLQARGQLDEALRIRWEEQIPVYERLGDVHHKALTMHRIADVLQARGQFDEALRILSEEVLPVVERLGDVRSKAITMCKIADVLQTRGQLDEELKIRWIEEIPVYERLGDVLAKANTMGRIADVLQARGQLDEALKIRWEEQIPVYERLGDMRAKAITMGNIADVLQERGQLDEALRIRWEEQIPVYERLVDVRSKAVTMGKIADVLQAQGQQYEALKILREEVLPALEALGDRREVCAGRTSLARTLLLHGHPADVPEACALLLAAEADAIEMNLPTALAAIRSWFRRAGLPT